MNTYVWIKKCKKQSICKHCGKPIVKGSYLVMCQMYRESKKEDNGGKKNWWLFRRFHPQCWIDQGIAAVSKIPVVETRGRKRVPMTDGTKSARFKIMQRRASIMQRLKKATVEVPYDIDKIIHLGTMIDELKAEIIEQGGLPKSWE